MADEAEKIAKLIAAIAYGEASTSNESDEIGGIAFSVANRCRKWGKTILEIRSIEPNYAYAWDGTNARFNKIMKASDTELSKDAGMTLALEWAKKAVAGTGDDPSNGGLWWDGLDFKTNYAKHPKVLRTFKWDDPSHNIFNVKDNPKLMIVRWQIKDKKTGRVVEGAERGRYDSVWISTAAHGKTIFWKYNPDFVKATGAKEYK